jgi:hypothetical protein
MLSEQLERAARHRGWRAVFWRQSTFWRLAVACRDSLCHNAAHSPPGQ